MRIAIDGRTIVRDRSGVGTYADRIVRSLLRLDQRNEYFLFLTKDIPGLEAPNLRKIVIERIDVMIFNRWWENVRLPAWLSRHKVDVYFSPAYALPMRPRPRNSTRYVVTVHDVIADILPKTFTWKMRLWQTLFNRNAAAKADSIIVDSECTKSDFVRVYGPSNRNISVVPLSVDESFTRVTDAAVLQRVRQRYSLPEAFILFLGTIEPRKNISGLAKAVALLPAQLRKQFPLVVCGARGWHSDAILQEIDALGISDSIQFIGFAEHEDVPALYSLATLFVYPSLYEGFGYPPLEAMSCGVPVVASNTSSLPEVVGDAGILVDPRDDRSLAESIQRVLTDTGLQGKLSQKGTERAKQFRWEITAARTLAILESAGRE